MKSLLTKDGNTGLKVGCYDLAYLCGNSMSTYAKSAEHNVENPGTSTFIHLG